MKTHKDNQLIAEFLGYRTFTARGYVLIHYADDNVWPAIDTHYHTSWDWLMPVVEKINSLTDEFGNHFQFQIGNGFVWVDPPVGSRIYFSGNGIDHRNEPMIQKVYNGVVEFINWYNWYKNK